MRDSELEGFRPVDVVKAWVTEKHDVLKYYVAICRMVRRKFSSFAESTYIDLYSGSGACRIDGTMDVIAGSPVAAVLAAQDCGFPFDRVFVADKDPTKAGACAERLREHGVDAEHFVGQSIQTVSVVVPRLNPNGFHFAFLDPFNLELPFNVLTEFQQLNHVDLLLHVSEMDVLRNLDQELSNPSLNRLELFAPGWRTQIDARNPKRNMAVQFLDYWGKLVESSGWSRPPEIRRIKNSKNRTMYHLALLSQNDKVAARFWNYAVKADVNQTELF